ncbi:MAG: RNA polymerase sigma factor [Novosphingobium sp.]|nr:RNA polymerase sigma factor [Novosphingobium sp.]
MQSDKAETADGGLAGLFAHHRAELLRFLAARCGGAEEAEDLLQELWIKASDQPSGPIANGRAYLFRMANNLVLDMRRAQQRAMARDRNWLEAEGYGTEPAEDRPDPALPADEEIARQQEADLVRQAITKLPPGAQRALRLHKLEGRGHAEVARIMGISRSGVEKHLAVAMKHLRNALADCGLLSIAASKGQTAIRGGEPRKDLGS